MEEFNRIVATTEFNGQRLFDTSSGDIRIHAGIGQDPILGLKTDEALARTAGNGSFNTAVTLATGTNTRTLEPTIADINGDGHLDLLVSSLDDGNITSLLGNGDGTFRTVGSYSVGDQGGPLRVGDLNEDGKLDVINLTWSSGKLQVLFGNGDGTFGAAKSYVAGTQNQVADLVDIDGDSDIDIVARSLVGNWWEATCNLKVLLNNGDGQFSGAATLNLPSSPIRNYDVADVNNDGLPDVVATDGTAIYTFENKGNLSFERTSSFNASMPWYNDTIKLADINQDGFQDLIDLEEPRSYISLRLGNGDGSFGAARTTAVSTAGTGISLTVGDLNGDGRPDLLVGEENSPSVDRMIYNGTKFELWGTSSTGSSSSYTAQQGQLGDLNEDGALDFTARFYNGGGGGTSIAIAYGDTRETVDTAYLNLLSQASARSAFATIDATLQRISSQLGELGATENRLNVAASMLFASRNNFEEAASRIRDADIGEEAANRTKASITQDAAASVLAQANLLPQLALSLLRGA